jgi:hypothetical protein
MRKLFGFSVPILGSSPATGGGGEPETPVDFDWTDYAMPSGFSAQSVSVTPDGQTIVIGGSNSKIRISTDAGANWTQHDVVNGAVSAGSITSIKISSDGQTIFCSPQHSSYDSGAAFRRAWLSTDAGVTWSYFEVSPVHNMRSVHASDDMAYMFASTWVGVNTNATFRSLNGGATWSVVAGQAYRVRASRSGQHVVAGLSKSSAYGASGTWTTHASMGAFGSVNDAGDRVQCRVKVPGGDLSGDRYFYNTTEVTDLQRTIYQYQPAISDTGLYAMFSYVIAPNAGVYVGKDGDNWTKQVGPTGAVNGADFSSDGTTLAIAAGNMLWIGTPAP